MHLFVDNLTNVDFSYLHPSRGLVGETWLASVVLEGALDQQGMVCDFGIVKKTLRQWLDQHIDHCLVVAARSDQLTLSRSLTEVTVDWRYKHGQSIYCKSPACAISLIDSEEVTPDTVARWCIGQLRALLPDTIDRIQLRFIPEVIEHHFYHYSHGLKKHSGNCQRIAHGHRSTIEIYLDSQRDHGLEQEWCQQWQDIYIGTREDLVQTMVKEGVNYAVFTYSAAQGEFTLQLPKCHCYLIDTDSTVEFIARHIADILGKRFPKRHIQVKAFEGIGKGALAFKFP
ncbi:MAG: 6-carboxytetrahydropterin synthase [Pseudomonadota bacterium]